jgi:hypothetical protein
MSDAITENIKDAAKMISAFCKLARLSGCKVCPMLWSAEGEPPRCICDVCEPRDWDKVKGFWASEEAGK